MYRRIDKGMKKTIATIAVAVLSFALLAGCGSKTVDPPIKSPDTTSTSTPPTTAPVTSQDDGEAVAKAATDLYATLGAESLAFTRSKQPMTYAAFDKTFAKSLAAVDLASFKTKKHAYAVVWTEGDFADFMASKSPKKSVRELYTIKDASEIKVIGDKATFETTVFPAFSEEPVEQVTFNKVNGKWLLDGAKYTDAFFKALGSPIDTFPIK